MPWSSAVLGKYGAPEKTHLESAGRPHFFRRCRVNFCDWASVEQSEGVMRGPIWWGASTATALVKRLVPANQSAFCPRMMRSVRQ